MAISTYSTTLMYKTTLGGTFNKLVDIKDFPDLGGAPELLETTTLSDQAQTFINGIQSMSAMEFTANYTSADFAKVVALKDTPLWFELQFGTDGADGKFDWEGELSVWVVGSGVNTVVDMKISIAPSSKITKV